MAQNLTAKPNNTETAQIVQDETAECPVGFVCVRSDTAKACSDAFARVSELEKLVIELESARKIEQSESERLKRQLDDLRSNYDKTLNEKNTELAELRKAVLELVRIASKRTKICVIC